MEILICHSYNDDVPLYINVEHIASFQEVAASTVYGTRAHTAIYMGSGAVEKVTESAAEIVSALQQL